MMPTRREPAHIRHRKAVYLWRLRAVLRTIPADAAPSLRAAWRLFAARTVAAHGRRTLARIVWPWQARSNDAVPRTPRGRLANPTALP